MGSPAARFLRTEPKCDPSQSVSLLCVKGCGMRIRIPHPFIRPSHHQSIKHPRTPTTSTPLALYVHAFLKTGIASPPPPLPSRLSELACGALR